MKLYRQPAEPNPLRLRYIIIILRKEMIPMKKLLNKKGFTLMEMLIVVAIIIILVAISIPAFSGQIDKAAIATDAANLRAAEAAYVMQTMPGGTPAIPSTGTAYYDIDEGIFKAASTVPADAKGGKCTTHKDAYIGVIGGKVTWTANGTTAIDPCN